MINQSQMNLKKMPQTSVQYKLRDQIMILVHVYFFWNQKSHLSIYLSIYLSYIYIYIYMYINAYIVYNFSCSLSTNDSYLF